MKYSVKTGLLLVILGAVAAASTADIAHRKAGRAARAGGAHRVGSKGPKIVKTEAEWKKLLTSDQYRVLREQGTEPPFANKYWNNHDAGHYACAACGNELFSSDSKFESGTGWPSFYKPIGAGSVETDLDNTLGMARTEVKCSKCGSHLGHVFDDGPRPTGLRYCMNSTALQFHKKP